jgi:hypothetical protein
MRTIPLLVVALLATGAPALGESRLPADWEQKVAAVVADAGRARQVVYRGRQFDEQFQASGAAMKRADAELKATFLSQASTVADRQLSLNVFRDDRRRAAISAADAIMKVRDLVSKKEWQGIWPEGYFTPATPGPPLSEKVQAALPSVVTDPARLKQAQDVAAALVKATRSDLSSGKKARARLEDLFENYDTFPDDFIDLVNKLNEDQERNDNAAIEAAGKLQAILTPGEWNALTKQLVPAP